MSEVFSQLNPQQLAAVTLPPGHALILAGAGSGKTRVLTARIAWLIEQRHCDAGGIMAVTFTNKAAREMLARLAHSLPAGATRAMRGMWVGTFHGLCNRLLRIHHREAALPQLFQILDVADQQAALKRLLKTLGVGEERVSPRELANFINGQKEAGVRAERVEVWDDFTRFRAELYREYEQQCQREGVADFAELLLRSYELLRNHEPLRHHYQRRFRHILVDEFQDTNRLQYAWLKLLAGHGEGAGNEGEAGAGREPDGPWLFCVGDDDQSIYRFRGADVGNMRDFEREFGIREVIRLEQNYRSHGNILDAANAIIEHNGGRLGKNLWTAAGQGEPIRVFEAFTDNEEARWIVDEIQSLVRDGSERREIAILYRSNAQSRVLEHALFSAGMAYRVYGGLRFFERQEVKHALAYLRLLANPHDDTAFARVVNFPTRGIGARSLENLQDVASANQISLWAAVPHTPGKAGKTLAGFVALIDTLRTRTEGFALSELIEQMLDDSGLREHYKNERDGHERLENLGELISAALAFTAEMSGTRGQPAGEGAPAVAHPWLAEFLAHASLEAGDHAAQGDEDAVQLMTMHSAKGLEFNAVFVAGLEEGLFPHDNSLLERDGLEEERRLMYVAVTRARRRLYLSFAQSRMLHGQVRYGMASRFVDEIPDGLLKWLTPRRARQPF